MAPAETLTVFLKLLAAGFYGVSSFLIVVVNKSVLTNYRWPGWRAAAAARRAGTGVRAHPGIPSATLPAALARAGGEGGRHNEAGAQGLATRAADSPGTGAAARPRAVAAVTETPGQKFVCVCLVFPLKSHLKDLKPLTRSPRLNFLEKSVAGS